MLNISKQIYVGLDTQITEHLHEASIMPLGDSLTEKKKLERFVTKYIDPTEYSNIPLPGFTLYDVNKRNYSSSDSTWLVIDPRGFMVRISQGNMANILRVSGITEGLIQQRCVWAREDSSTELSLVPVSSILYNEAVNNTELIESRVNISDVQIGDTVLLQNKMTGTYLGVMSLYCSLVGMNKDTGMKAQGMLRQQVIEVSAGHFFYKPDAKILKVLTKTSLPMSREDAVSYTNNIIATNPAAHFSCWEVFNTKYYGSRGRVKMVSLHAAPKIKLSIQEITKDEAVDLLSECRPYTDMGCVVLENSRQNKFLVDFPWWGASINTPGITNFYTTPIAEPEEDRVTFAENIRSNRTSPGRSTFSLDNFVKFYKIVKSVKNDTYV